MITAKHWSLMLVLTFLCFNRLLLIQIIIITGKMTVYSFVSRWSRFELLITTFQLQYYYSSSGDEVDCLRVAICSMMVRC